jgi:hypothetical protein
MLYYLYAIALIERVGPAILEVSAGFALAAPGIGYHSKHTIIFFSDNANSKEMLNGIPT